MQKMGFSKRDLYPQLNNHNGRQSHISHGDTMLDSQLVIEIIQLEGEIWSQQKKVLCFKTFLRNSLIYDKMTLIYVKYSR